MLSLKSVDSNAKILSQLPIQSYVDPNIFEIEKKTIFDKYPKYIGHRLMVPQHGNYHVLDALNRSAILANNHGKINVLSNICRHRQALMFENKGSASHIVCPLHRWTYDLNGELKGAPYFKETPCLNLELFPAKEIHGLIFKQTHKQTSLNIKDAMNFKQLNQLFNFESYKLHSIKIDHYDFNWKTFIEVYLEDYHVWAFHPGLNNIVNCENLTWEFKSFSSIQKVPFREKNHSVGSPIYDLWKSKINEQSGDTKPGFGAIWLTIYPFYMIEWYPNVIVVSHLVPDEVDRCRNIIEFYYPEETILFDQDYIDAQQAAYNETALEDKVICEKMQEGRRLLFKNKQEDVGPYHEPLEDGLKHFHQWYQLEMSSYL
jgi:phenylpropionate dioxygenase-like ring-hydroxylating dioxygenase large terminal subunit